jgi:hypothetical protein
MLESFHRRFYTYSPLLIAVSLAAIVCGFVATVLTQRIEPAAVDLAAIGGLLIGYGALLNPNPVTRGAARQAADAGSPSPSGAAAAGEVESPERTSTTPAHELVPPSSRLNHAA